MMLYRLLRGQEVTNLVLVRHYFHSHVYVLLVFVRISTTYAALCYSGLWVCTLISLFVCQWEKKPNAVCTNASIHELLYSKRCS